jgi:uncharacterized membrane protein SpoIIM required for sporulation
LNLAGVLDRTIRPYLLILTLLFAASFLAGTIAPPSIRRQMADMFQIVAGSYRDIAGGMLFFNILVQNVMATIFVLISGVILGIVPTFAIGSNGFGLGVLFGQASEASGYLKAALKVLPYGVFEIPALGVVVVRRMRGKESTPLGVQIELAFRGYFAVVFPLLVVAAAIETTLILWLQRGT